MEELFNSIAEEENTNCEVLFENAYAPYIFLPLVMKENGYQIKTLKLNIPYRDQIIEVIYEIGDNKRASLTCVLNDQNSLAPFRISSGSHYARFFNDKKDILKVECDNSSLGNNLILTLKDLGIEGIARRDQFEPDISCINNGDGQTIITSYHLAFAEKGKVLRPLIAFYKSLIDYSKERLVSN